MPSMFNKFALDSNMIMAFLKDANVVGAEVDALTNVVTLHVDEDSPDVMFDLTPLLVDLVEKEDGKGLSSNDFTDALKARLEEIQDQEQADWAEDNPNHISYIKNKPDLYLPTHLVRDVLDELSEGVGGELLYKNKPTDSVQSDYGETDATKVSYIKNKPTLHEHLNKDILDNLGETTGSELTFKGIVVSGVQSDWAELDTSDPSYIKNKPVLYDPANKDVLNELTEDANGELNYRGVRVNTEYQSDWAESDNTKPWFIRNKPPWHHHDNLPVLNGFDEDEDNHLTWRGDLVAMKKNMITGISDTDEYGIPTQFNITTA